ncbi:hypothetical protein [Bacillus sp. S/N-304-OC-R1]|uniref:hypothetical protein n=1 Tax=Bacillus sp. S/N-304-OC-R1 TaxID=2758034 RepID=UPI001C8EC1ED|nr:hypothetical protein [Bacillus sp. S/N-304-OC-R1]MBY0124115.1 hypothetical protein [Bacillus sp. S/N-304-OC-R1]
MKVEDVIVDINKYMEQLDFVTARKLIEENLEVLNKHRIALKSNARELLKFLTDRHESGHEAITRQEMATLIAINTYATNFDVRGLKLIIKDKAKLLLRSDVIQYLNKDARVILDGMGVIAKLPTN